MFRCENNLCISINIKTGHGYVRLKMAYIHMLTTFATMCIDIESP